MAKWLDDGLICSNKKKTISDIFDYLKVHFEMRSTTASCFVGLTISRDHERRKLYLSQPSYIKKFLRKFGMEECNPKSLPADPSSRLPHLDEKRSFVAECQTTNREAVGSLMYLMTASRPDIAFAVG